MAKEVMKLADSFCKDGKLSVSELSTFCANSEHEVAAPAQHSRQIPGALEAQAATVLMAVLQIVVGA